MKRSRQMAKRRCVVCNEKREHDDDGDWCALCERAWLVCRGMNPVRWAARRARRYERKRQREVQRGK